MFGWLKYRRQNLHAFTGVAQLKPSVPPHPQLGLSYLHAFTGVAQLKPTLTYGIDGAIVISTPSPAWPN